MCKYTAVCSNHLALQYTLIFDYVIYDSLISVNLAVSTQIDQQKARWEDSIVRIQVQHIVKSCKVFCG